MDRVPPLSRDVFENLTYKEQLITGRLVKTLVGRVYPDHIILVADPRENALYLLCELNKMRSEPRVRSQAQDKILKTLNAGMIGHCSMMQLETLETEQKLGMITNEVYSREIKFWNEMVKVAVAASVIERP